MNVNVLNVHLKAVCLKVGGCELKEKRKPEFTRKLIISVASLIKSALRHVCLQIFYLPDMCWSVNMQMITDFKGG